MGKKHKKGKKLSKSAKNQLPKKTVKKKSIPKWIYIIIGIIAIFWMFNQFSENNYPEISSPKVDRGVEDAKILLEEFSDLECPACRSFHPIIQKVMAEYPDDIKWRYYHYPLTRIHPNAQTAAIGAECANDQGLFWEYIDTVYEFQKDMKKNDLISYAVNVGAEESSFKECINSKTKNDEIALDVAEGNKRKITGTPSIFINGKQVSLSYNELKTAIELELSQ